MTRKSPPALKEKKHARIKGPRDGPIERTADFFKAKALQDDAFCERWGSPFHRPAETPPPFPPAPKTKKRKQPLAEETLADGDAGDALASTRPKKAPRGNKNSNRGMGGKAATQVTRRQ
ncbi:hypothetical protein MY3296_008963 [Beauveria thailandica]